MQRAQTIDLQRDLLPGTRQRHAVAATQRQHVARLQRHELGDVAEQLRHATHPIPGVTRLESHLGPDVFSSFYATLDEITASVAELPPAEDEGNAE